MSEEKQSTGQVWARFNRALSKTRERLTTSLSNLVLGEKEINARVLEELEASLLIADVGVSTTQAILRKIASKVKRKELNNTDTLYEILRQELLSRTKKLSGTFFIGEQRPFVVLIVGVNGVGKTTTIVKLAKRIKDQGLSVLLAAGDTFRAAAIEQLQKWSDRIDVPVVAQKQGSDSASVIYDAIESARARQVDVVIADTAGRLQTKKGLMDELAKVKRVIQRLDETAPHQIMLVLDATVGQNALSQVKEFKKAVGLTGITITKLDGTAKAGVVLALGNESDTPVQFVGLGESIDDLQPFDAEAFTDALLTR